MILTFCVPERCQHINFQTMKNIQASHEVIMQIEKYYFFSKKTQTDMLETRWYHI